MSMNPELLAVIRKAGFSDWKALANGLRSNLNLRTIRGGGEGQASRRGMREGTVVWAVERGVTRSDIITYLTTLGISEDNAEKAIGMLVSLSFLSRHERSASEPIYIFDSHGE